MPPNTLTDKAEGCMTNAANAPTRRGRKPGSLVHGKCRVCGTVELCTGDAGHYRCGECKSRGLRTPTQEKVWGTGKDNAHLHLYNAIRDGLLPHPRGLPCSDCSGTAIEYDHRDYNEPLRVEPVCRSCNLRRGPAIPARGSIERMVLRGWTPYILRHRARQLFVALGMPADALANMPAKLNNGHWRELLPLFVGADRRETEAV